jgi:hypothetical protein
MPKLTPEQVRHASRIVLELSLYDTKWINTSADIYNAMRTYISLPYIQELVQSVTGSSSTLRELIVEVLERRRFRKLPKDELLSSKSVK